MTALNTHEAPGPSPPGPAGHELLWDQAHEAAGTHHGHKGPTGGWRGLTGATALPGDESPRRLHGGMRDLSLPPGASRGEGAAKSCCPRGGADPGRSPGAGPGETRCPLGSRGKAPSRAPPAGQPLPVAWHPRGWGQPRCLTPFLPALRGKTPPTAPSGPASRRPAPLTCSAPRRRPQEDEPAAAHAAAEPSHAAAPPRLLWAPGGGGTL